MLFPVSIGNFVSFLAYLFASILTHLSYKKRKIEFTFYFLRAFILSTNFFFIVSLPGIVSQNPTLNCLTSLASYILIYSIIASYVLVLCRFVDSPTARNSEKIILLILFAFLIFTIYLGIKNFQPSYLVFQGNFSYWVPRVKPIIRIIIGLTSAGLGIVFASLALLIGKKSKDRKVFRRSLFIAGGMLSLIAGSFVNYVGGAVPSPANLLLASLFTALSAFLFLGGVLYKVGVREDSGGKS